MRIITAIVFTLLLGTARAEPQPNAGPAAESLSPKELVERLGDLRFKTRDAAEKALIRLGLSSFDALVEGEKHPDPHVRGRCRELQPIIRSIVLQKRIDRFIANINGPLAKDLPFAAPFINITGDSKEARELYAEVLQANAQLLDEADRDPKKGIEIFSAFCQEVQSRLVYRPGVEQRALQKTISKADVTLYFLLSVELKQDANGRISNSGYSFLSSTNLIENLGKDAPAAVPFKKLFLVWLEKEPQPYMVQRGLQIAADAKMPEVVPLILKLINDKNVQVYTRAQTALSLAKIGTKVHLKDLEPLLQDKTVVGSFGINNKMGEVQMRDVALAVSIKLSGQKIGDYDFDVMKTTDDLIHMSYCYCAFSSDAKRDEAHKKYKESVEKRKEK